MHHPPFTPTCTPHLPSRTEGLAAAQAVRPSVRRHQYCVVAGEGGLLTSDTDARLAGAFNKPPTLTFTLDDCTLISDDILDAVTALAAKEHA